MANNRGAPAVYGCMSSAVRIETSAAAGLSQVSDWLSRHRGLTVELGHARHLELGVPITAARAVLVAVTLLDGDGATPHIGGVVRAIASPHEGDPVRLVFDGRSPAHLSTEEAASEAEKLLDAIATLMDEPAQQVA